MNNMFVLIFYMMVNGTNISLSHGDVSYYDTMPECFQAGNRISLEVNNPKVKFNCVKIVFNVKEI